MRWLAKSAVQNLLSVLPRGVEANALLQRYGTRSVVMTPERVAARLGRVVTPHVRHHETYSTTAMGETTVFEIGTGFTPLVPVGLHLAGAGSIVTYDIVELTTTRSLLDLLRSVTSADAKGLLAEPCPWILPDRMARLRELVRRPPGTRDGILAELGVTYRIGDASATGMDPGSVDFFVTNNVFEHIPRDAIRDLLRESSRLGREGAVISHHIDLRDHYAKFDRSIDVFHYLRYSDRQWRFLNSRLEPQNRLRHSDYLDLISAARFEILSDDVTRGPEEVLARTPLADRFRRYPPEELRIVDMRVVARKSASGR